MQDLMRVRLQAEFDADQRDGRGIVAAGDGMLLCVDLPRHRV